MSNKNKSKFSFIKPAVYKIKVQGDVNVSWSERLAGLQIIKEESENNKPISVLIGQINDQAALSGILNALYENHLSIISVNLLEDRNE